MRLEQSFEVAAPVERVWEALIDVEHVAPCLPGASVTARNEDGSYSGAFRIKIGPTTASYVGRLEMEKVDEAARTATMQANGSDKRGQGGAKATIFSTLKPTEAGGTHVEVITEYHITGRLARFGRGGMIEDISERLLREFADRLQASLVGAEPAPPGEPASAAEPAPAPEPPPALEAPPAPEPQPTQPLEAIPLLRSVLWQRARRNPAPLAFLAALALVVLLIRRGRQKSGGGPDARASRSGHDRRRG